MENICCATTSYTNLVSLASQALAYFQHHGHGQSLTAKELI